MFTKNLVVAAAKLVFVGYLFSQFPSIDSPAVADNIVALSSVKVQDDAKYVYLSDFRQQDKQFSDEDLAQLLYCVGFRGLDLREAWSVAKKESNGRPLAYNGNAKTGDSSYGIFQINMIGNLGPERRAKYDLSDNKELFNPVTNASIAFKMTSGGDNWSSWKGLTPKTKQWLAKFPAVSVKQYVMPDLSALKV